MRYIILLILCCCYLTSYAQFGEERVISTYSYTNPVVLAGDIDNDGDQDLLTTSFSDKKLAWIENSDGLGSYTKEQVLDNTKIGRHIALADINNDSLLDIVYVSDSQLGWYQNEEAGRFRSEITLDTYTDIPKDLKVIDLDLDGDEDLILINDSGILFYENTDGSAQFGPKVVLENRTDGLNIHPADMDGDGDIDILSMGASANGASILLHENLSENNFESTGDNIFSIAGRSIDAADIDNDNDLDIVLSIWGKQEAVWIENLGARNFGDTTHIVNKIKYAEDHAVADYDNDGDMDVMVLAYDDQTITWAENLEGKGNFGNKSVILETSYDPRSAISTDVDNDGYQDLVVSTSSSIFWTRNLAGEEFSPAMLIPEGTVFSDPIAAADMDNDGDIDIISCSFGNKSIQWHENDGLGFFTETHYIRGNLNNPTDLEIDDVNQDGLPDIFYTNSETFALLLNDGTGDFQHLTLLDQNTYAIEKIQVVDLDGDGRKDLIQSLNELNWMKNLDGNGTYSDPIMIQDEDAFCEAMDINDDGDFDLLVTGVNFGWYENDGSGNFGSLKLIEPDPNYLVSQIVQHDVDGDGLQDVFIVKTGEIAWYPYLGNGTFGAKQVLDMEGRSVLFVDIDDDSEIDILNSFGMWYENLGNGNYSEGQELGQDFQTARNLVADMDGDGDDDLVYVNPVVWDIYWRANLQEKALATGRSFFDENANGTKESNEVNLLNQEITLLPDGLSQWTNTFGVTNFRVESGSHTMEHLPATDWSFTTPDFYNFDTANFNNNFDFGLVPEKEYGSVEINITSAPTRCSFTIPAWVSIRNTGTQTLTGKVSLEMDELTDYISSDQNVAVDGKTLTWQVSELYPSYEQVFRIEVRIASVAFLGAEIILDSSAELYSADNTLAQVEALPYSSIINCAYDPNDKLVHPDREGEENYTLFEEKLIYTVRFQNTGTDTAFTVVIRDDLDANLDWTTMRPLTASHDYETTLNERGQLTFTFDNILLPDSTTNEALSHGFIKYSIEHKDDLPENTVISNTAGIIFDFNEPVITNTTINTLVSELPTSTTSIDLQESIVKVYPNPTDGKLVFELLDTDNAQSYKLNIFNGSGQSIADRQLRGSRIELDLGGHAAGIYYYQLVNKDSQEMRAVGRFVIQ